jgi:hypothetical protein
MNPTSAGESECIQSLNSIYAWSRLLELHSTDPTLITQAVHTIQRNAERLLRKIVEAAEVS